MTAGVDCRFMWIPKRPTLALLFAGAVVHAGVMAVVYVKTGRIDGYAFQSLDGREYYGLARSLLDHGVFSTDSAPPHEPDTWRTPGYPLFLSLVMLLAGKSPAALIVAQQILSVLNVLVLFAIARRLMTPGRALAVSLLFLLEPYHLLYSTWLMSTTLTVTVLFATWYALLRAVERRTLISFAVTGALSGLLVLVRPLAILVPLAALACVVTRLLTKSRTCRSETQTRNRWVGIAVFCVFAAVTIGAWTARNYAVSGRFALSDQGGVVLAYFKATEVVLWEESRTADRYLETSLDPENVERPHRVWDDIDTRLRRRFSDSTEDQAERLTWRNIAQGNKSGVDSFQVSRWLAGIAWSMLAEAPLATLGCCIVRIGENLTFPLNLAVSPPNGVGVNRAKSLAVALPYVVLTLAAFIGMIRNRDDMSGICFPILCAAALLLATTPQVDPRFRVPIIPLLLVIAFCNVPPAAAPDA